MGRVVTASGISEATIAVGTIILKSCAIAANKEKRRLVSKIKQEKIINSINVFEEREKIRS